MRILVTGSRDWKRYRDIGQPLKGWLQHLEEVGHTLTIVHGGCPTGADAFASEWCDAHPEATEEVWRADWKQFGRVAGPIRNKAMVESGFDLCLAFIKNDSRGASGTLELAKEYRRSHPQSRILLVQEWS